MKLEIIPLTKKEEKYCAKCWEKNGNQCVEGEKILSNAGECRRLVNATKKLKQTCQTAIPDSN